MQSLAASVDRPIPFARRTDLVVVPQSYRGALHHVVKDPVARTYCLLPPIQRDLLELLDGQRSLGAIRHELALRHPFEHITTPDVRTSIESLFDRNLVLSTRRGSVIAGRSDAEAGFLVSRAINPLFLKLPPLDAQPVLDRLSPPLGWLFRPRVVAFASILILASWGLLLVRFDDFRRHLPSPAEFLGWSNLLQLWLVFAFAKVCHELGHGLACRAVGGECHGIGVVLLVFCPSLYCDVSDTWLMTDKWRRIGVAAAGVYVELLLSCVAIGTFWATRDGMLRDLALNLFVATTVTTVILNANPLVRFDGYFALADFVEIPNLRVRADRRLRDLVAAWFFDGPAVRNDDPRWLAAFALASWCYRWFVIGGIIWFLSTVLSPYGLQSLGVAAGSFVGVSVVLGVWRSITRMTASRGTRTVSRWRTTVVGIGVVALLVVSCTVPISVHVHMPCLVEPRDVVHVYATESGRLDRQLVTAGARVERGETLLELREEEHDDRVWSRRREFELAKAEVEVASALGRPELEQLAADRLSHAGESLREAVERRERLTVAAPVSGIVVPPARRPTPPQDDAAMSTWSGTPLDARNLGARVDVGTHLMSIDPERGRNAVLFVDQSLRDELRERQVVEVVLDDRPAEILRGVVVSISDERLEFAPAELSESAGDVLATRSDERGRERLQHPVYRATVRLDERKSGVRVGGRGRARVLAHRRTLAGWAWRYVRSTFDAAALLPDPGR